eukprot:TRINITY_DN108805_c0_g1_i1.p1 TRINITY_DN108805_c0_g1~~TRINITY_DN108805_c0_g1_i1.p1  ORF type:complete len:281 (-),score=56.63 TRINITY_DN108805_c0_g1_i1:46-888(-)
MPRARSGPEITRGRAKAGLMRVCRASVISALLTLSCCRAPTGGLRFISFSPAGVGRWSLLRQQGTRARLRPFRASSGSERTAADERDTEADIQESKEGSHSAGLSQRLRQRLAAEIAEQESQVEAVPTEDQKRIVQQDVDLNGVDPVACFFGALPVAGLSAGFWTFTGRAADWFVSHPVETDFYPAQRLGYVFQAAIVGLSSLAAGIFGFTALGIFLLGIRVAFGVATGELDPKKQGQSSEKRSTAETVFDVFTKDPVQVVKEERRRKEEASLRNRLDMS